MELVYRDATAGLAPELAELKNCVVLTGSEAVSRSVEEGERGR